MNVVPMVQFTWESTEFLREQGVKPYSDMPIWTPADPLAAVDHSHAQFHMIVKLVAGAPANRSSEEQIPVYLSPPLRFGRHPRSSYCPEKRMNRCVLAIPISFLLRFLNIPRF